MPRLDEGCYYWQHRHQLHGILVCPPKHPSKPHLGVALTCRSGDSSYPYCVTYQFQDESLHGYSMLGCDYTGATKEIWNTPTSMVTTATATVTQTSIRTCGSGGSSSDSCPSTIPVGAIVGGVVGGLAGIALVILCIWALRRRSNKRRQEAAEATEAATAAQEQQFDKPLQPQPYAPQYYTTELPAMRGEGELTELPLPVAELPLPATRGEGEATELQS